MEKGRQARLLTQAELDQIYSKLVDSEGSAELRDELLEALGDLALADSEEFWQRINRQYGTAQVNVNSEALEAMQSDLMERISEVKESQGGDN